MVMATIMMTRRSCCYSQGLWRQYSKILMTSQIIIVIILIVIVIVITIMIIIIIIVIIIIIIMNVTRCCCIHCKRTTMLSRRSQLH